MRAAGWVTSETIQIAKVSGAPIEREQRHGRAAHAHLQRRAERPLQVGLA